MAPGIATGHQFLLQCLRFILVDLAAQGVNCKLHIEITFACENFCGILHYIGNSLRSTYPK
jgi:hypothetical protein